MLSDLGTLSLPACDAMTILEALSEGSMSPGSLSFCLGGIDDISRLDAVFQSRCRDSLKQLHLSHLNGLHWKALTEAIKSGALRNVRSFRVSNSALRGVDLADLATDSQEWFCSLESLAIVGCGLTSEDFRSLVGCSPLLALKSLDLHDNDLDCSMVNDLMRLATNDQLPLLKELDLSKNLGLSKPTGSRSLVEFYTQRVCLRNLSKLNWEGNRISDGDLEAIVGFYYSDPALIRELHISWNLVSDVSLRTKLKTYRDRNVRLVSFWTDLEARLRSPDFSPDFGHPSDYELELFSRLIRFSEIYVRRLLYWFRDLFLRWHLVRRANLAGAGPRLLPMERLSFVDTLKWGKRN